MSFEKKIKRLSSRDWIQVANDQLQYAAQLSLTQAGQAPAFHLSELQGLSELIPKIPRDGEYRDGGLPGLRAALLHEGIFMLHKSGNVLVASHDQVQGGLPTWSLPTGYQAAFFAAEGILKILGVAIIESANVACTIDVWPKAEAALKGKALAQYSIGSEIQFIRHDRLQHFHRWAILQRVLRMTMNHPLDPDLYSAVLALDEKDFARQRNELHYETAWKFADMHGYYSQPGFFDVPNKAALIACLNPDRDDFSVALGTVLFSFGIALLKPLAQVSAVIDGERQLLATSCTAPRMKLRSAFEASGSGTLA